MPHYVENVPKNLDIMGQNLIMGQNDIMEQKGENVEIMGQKGENLEIHTKSKSLIPNTILHIMGQNE